MVYLEDAPLWYKDAIIYELHVRAFHDGNGDGIGDFVGLTQKLDYLEDLGITAIWLLPFYPSPLRDDGYDISDYFNVHPSYGTLKDFKGFLREAHRRGIRVITELVLNHTSDQHPWFQRSRKARPGSTWRDFYVWSDTQDRYQDARIIFKDFEISNWAWDPVAGANYWHRFYSHQPDLNFDHPHVRKVIFRALDFWLGMGVDGLRLDAVPYLFEREGTNCENLPETYAFLKELRSHVDSRFKNRMLLAEANQWPEDATAYFGNGDICHMAFHFPLMPRIFIGIQMENRFPIVDILEQTPKIPETCQWTLFLRNHDELTLEMVTDEERDYMYRVYARDPHARINLGIRRRLAPLMGNNRRRIELMNMLLFSLPGTPVIYYGDEIGMGDNYYLGDRNGVRTPMQWSPDRNAGFSRANPQKLYLPVIIDPEYHYESLNVENQQRNPSSLLWWMKQTIAARKRFKSPGRGALEFLFPENPKILAFLRRYEDETILIVANLSRFFQVAQLDLSPYAEYTPVEISSQNRFPAVKESPYTLTLGPHNYLLLLIKKEEEGLRISGEKVLPELRVKTRWEALFEGKTQERLEQEVLPNYLQGCRWFGGKAKTIRAVSIVERIPFVEDSNVSHMLLLEISYKEGTQDLYLLPISFSVTRKGEEVLEEFVVEGQRVRLDYDWLTIKARMVMEEFPQSVIARLHIDNDEGILYDATYDGRFRQSLITAIARRRRIRGKQGAIIGLPGKAFRRLAGDKTIPFGSQPLKAEQSNTSMLFEDKFCFKLFRRLEEGPHPDKEMTQFLTEMAGFSAIPPYAGSIEYQQPGSEPTLIGLLQGFVSNQGNAWTYTLDAVGRYFENVLSRLREIQDMSTALVSPFETDLNSVPPLLRELIEGHYLEMTALLGKRTAQMHRALSGSSEEGDFTPEPFSMLYQRSVYQSMRTLLRRVIQALKSHIQNLQKPIQEEASFVLDSEQKILDHFQKIVSRKFSAMRIRIHGDYHLGQVLYTGKDFFIIDFEGEPARPLSERRWKRSALRDVTGMVRSFHYAAYVALLRETSIRSEDVPVLRPWTDLWYRCISGVYVRSYLDTVGKAPFIPVEKEELELLLNVFLLEKAVYEVGYELNNRPEWVVIPLRGIRDLLGSD
ncbi:MAG: maltose alpha-D-glucosyltransferase [Deltaproteobacteria bacterium RBG_16_47_11]|nr:MAG: maltose alpha-D-glucosyltransferase [Deltaproteobacteria bacterium RBG_16_47_11]